MEGKDKSEGQQGGFWNFDNRVIYKFTIISFFFNLRDDFPTMYFRAYYK